MLPFRSAAPLFVALVALVAACGNPQPAQEDDARRAVPIDPTQGAARDKLNEKLAAVGKPTINPSLTDAEATATVEVSIATVQANTTPLPRSTPSPPSCGPREGPNSGAAIVEKYGELRTNCGPFGQVKYIATAGTDMSPGVMAVLVCPHDDLPCINGEEPRSDVEWAIAPGPHGGPVKVIGAGPEPGQIIVNNGGAQCRFDLTTYEYKCS